MNLINDEKEQFIDALKGKYTFKEINKKLESYFELYDNIPNVEELSFENIPQLKMLLQRKKKVIVSEQIDNLCAIAAFKNKPPKEDSQVNNSAQMELPDFIYNM